MNARFEHDRLALFRAVGVSARSVWIDDRRLGCRTYAMQVGEGPCPTILVHGGMSEASVWYRLVPLLDTPLLLVDRPGHGLSSDVDYGRVDFRAHATSWLTGVLDGLGIEQANLVGNSMGGYFSTVFALEHPSRVRRLVLAGAPAGTDRELPLFLRLWRLPIIGHLFGLAMRTVRDPQQVRRRALGSMCRHPERVSDAAVLVQAAATRRPRWNAMMRSMIRAASDAGGWRESLSIREAMLSLTRPTLFAWGEHDSFAPPSSGEQIAARMNGARFEVIADAGHLPQLDQPEALAASIRRFLDSSRGHASTHAA